MPSQNHPNSYCRLTLVCKWFSNDATNFPRIGVGSDVGFPVVRYWMPEWRKSTNT